MVTEGIIERLPSGKYDQDRCRLAYLKWLRDPARRSARSEAASEFSKAKTELIRMRIRERAGQLMEVAEAVEIIEALTALFRTGLGSLPAVIGGRDLSERRRIEGLCNRVLNDIADEAERRAAACIDPSKAATKQERESEGA